MHPPVTLYSESKLLKPKLYDLLLEVARRAPLFLTPARQPFVNLTSGAIPLYSEDFRGWLSHQLIAENLPFPSPVTSCRILRQLDEDAHHLPNLEVHPAHLRIESTPRGYYIDLKKGTDPIHLTGKHWQQEPNPSPAFFRPETNNTLTTPTHSHRPLNTHLSQAFGISEGPAAQLAQWLQLAMRPDQLCPLLIITGDLRDEATRAIRQLIDPGTCAILPLPVTQNQMGEMALFNRVLAFSMDKHLSPTKRSAIRSISQGTGVRLRQANPHRPRISETLRRPVILSAEVAPALCRNQINIEINQANEFATSEVLAALLDELVLTLRRENKVPLQLPSSSTITLNTFIAAAYGDAPIP